MAVLNEAITVHYYAFDVTTGVPQTGDHANHTLRVAADGVVGTIAASPAQLDATNMPGWYRVAVASGENTGRMMVLAGASATSNVKLVGQQWSNETRTDAMSADAVAAIWDAALSSISTSNTIGKLIEDKLTLITSTSQVQLIDLFADGDLMTIFKGSSKTIELLVDHTTLNLTDHTPKFGLLKKSSNSNTGDNLEVTGTLSNAGAAGQKVSFTLSTTNTGTLAVDMPIANVFYQRRPGYDWQISATNGSGSCPTLAAGQASVLARATTC